MATTAMGFIAVVLILMIGSTTSEFCYHTEYGYDYIGHYYYSYISYYGECGLGCCGTEYDRSCCTDDDDEDDEDFTIVAVIIGASIGGVVFVSIFLTILICCICKAANKNSVSPGTVISRIEYPNLHQGGQHPHHLPPLPNHQPATGPLRPSYGMYHQPQYHREIPGPPNELALYNTPSNQQPSAGPSSEVLPSAPPPYHTLRDEKV